MHKHELYLSRNTIPSLSDRKTAMNVVFNCLSPNQLPLRGNLPSYRKGSKIAIATALAQREMGRRMYEAKKQAGENTTKAPSAAGDRQAVFEGLTKQYLGDVKTVTIYIATERPSYSNFNVHGK